MKERGYTTITVSKDDSDKLDRLSKASGVSKKDFISLSLDYFSRNGINPKTAETPIAEIEKITKRFNQFFAFFKKQEQEILHPMYIDIVAQNVELKENIANLKEILLKVHNANVMLFDKNEKELKNKIDTSFSKNSEVTKSEALQIKTGIENLLRLVDEKNKSGLLGKLFG